MVVDNPNPVCIHGTSFFGRTQEIKKIKKIKRVQEFHPQGFYCGRNAEDEP